jgi:hypothetical protein
MLILVNSPHPCAATTKRGAPCRAYPVDGSPYCNSHNEAVRERTEAARRLGGQRRRRHHAPPPDAVSLRTVEDALALLERAAGDALRLDTGVARVRALVQCAVAAVGILESTEIEERLTRLEEALNARKGGRPAWAA